nr:ribonuclease H-like domain-containing protein [Tanacetum cinerariifolium]
MSVHNSEHNTPINYDHDDDINDSVTIISKLDISDPLHLHPNDTTALTVVSIKLKGTKNYQVWPCAMLSALEGKNKIGLIDGSCKRSHTDRVFGKQSSILSREVLPDVRSAYATISSEESHRVVVGSIVGQVEVLVWSVKIMVLMGILLIDVLKSLDTLLILGKKHDQNFKKQSVSNNYSVGKSSSSVFSDEQIATLLSLIKDNKIRKNMQANIAGTYSNQSSIFHKNFHKFYCSNANFKPKLVNYGKIVDSKANQHMTYTDKGLDNVIDISHLKIKVGNPNRTEAFISKIGNLKLSNGLTLYDVMVILGYCVTLIYVYTMEKKNKIFVVFDESKCCFVNQDLNLKNVLGIGEQCEGLHYYNEQGTRVNKSNQNFQCLLSQFDWHCRLGHPAEPVMNVLKKSLKFDKSEKCVPSGYSSVKKGYRLYSLDKHQFIFSRDVKFFENIFPFKDSDKVKDVTENIFQDVNHINFFDLEYPEKPNDDEIVDPNLNCGNKKSQSASSSSSETGRISVTFDFSDTSENDANSSDNKFATQDEGVTTLEENVFSKGNMDQKPNIVSQDNQNLRRIEKYVGYSKLNSNNYCFVTQLNKNFEPESFSEASKFPHWIDAVNQEMNALLRNGNWDIVDLPKGRKAIGSKWIYKIKFQSSGEIDRFKARLIAQGFGQKEGIDYEKTFSHVLDVNNAFLYGDLDEVVYMRPPKGFFFLQIDKGVFLALLVYVDDIIITGNNVDEIKKFNVFLKSKFMIKDLGKLKYFLGIEVVDTEKGIYLNQRKYVLDLLSEYGMLACKPVDTPLLSKLVISNEATKNDHVLQNITDYQKLIDKLIYLTNTRPNISCVVHCLSQFMHSPLKSHLKTAFKILRYLSLGVHFVKTSGMFHKDFSNVDWAKCVVTKKYVTGYCVF